MSIFLYLHLSLTLCWASLLEISIDANATDFLHNITNYHNSQSENITKDSSFREAKKLKLKIRDENGNVNGEKPNPNERKVGPTF